MPRSSVDLQNGLHLQSWKPFNNSSCLLECPPGFEEVPTENSFGKVFKCQKCSGILCLKFKFIIDFNF